MIFNLTVHPEVGHYRALKAAARIEAALPGVQVSLALAPILGALSADELEAKVQDIQGWVTLDLTMPTSA